jgi:hypothetical protein
MAPRVRGVLRDDLPSPNDSSPTSSASPRPKLITKPASGSTCSRSRSRPRCSSSWVTPQRVPTATRFRGALIKPPSRGPLRLLRPGARSRCRESRRSSSSHPACSSSWRSRASRRGHGHRHRVGSGRDENDRDCRQSRRCRRVRRRAHPHNGERLKQARSLVSETFRRCRRRSPARRDGSSRMTNCACPERGALDSRRCSARRAGRSGAPRLG